MGHGLWSPPVSYLAGTPKGRLTALEKDFLGKPWSQAREAVSVKLLEQEDEVYILAKSEGRVLKERAMRRKKLKKYWARLKELLEQAPSRDQLLLKLGAAQKEAGRAKSLVTVTLPKASQPVTPETFTFTLNRRRLRACRRATKAGICCAPISQGKRRRNCGPFTFSSPKWSRRSRN